MIDGTSMMHGRDWRGEDLAGWWISEKLHGCRAYWDGRQMWTRGGCAIAIPDTWRAELPEIALDGEIYAGIGRFREAFAAAVYGRFDASVRFMVFDASVPGALLDRLAMAGAAVNGARCAIAVEHRPCPSTADVMMDLHRIRAKGGEGLIARNPANVYRAGRTGQILKLKRI